MEAAVGVLGVARDDAHLDIAQIAIERLAIVAATGVGAGATTEVGAATSSLAISARCGWLGMAAGINCTLPWMRPAASRATRMLRWLRSDRALSQKAPASPSVIGGKKLIAAPASTTSINN